MAVTIEREVKLRFDDPGEARRAILEAGATPLRGRRLQEDCLLDFENERLKQQRCVLRIRTNLHVYWDQVFVAPLLPGGSFRAGSRG